MCEQKPLIENSDKVFFPRDNERLMMSVMAKVMMLIIISWGGTLAAPTLLAQRITQEKTDDTVPLQK